MKELLKQLGKPRHTSVEIGGTRVGVAKWSIGASDRIESVRKRYHDNEATYAEYVAAVILETVCDDAGVRVFTENDKADVMGMSAEFVRDLFFACMRQNGIELTMSDIEEAEAESEERAGGSEKNS